MPEIPETLRAWCADRAIRIIDSRDPIGDEKLHHVLEKLRAEDGRDYWATSVPVSQSGVCMRGESETTRRDVAGLQAFIEGAWLDFQRREGAQRPYALEVCNYGASVYARRVGA